MQNSFQLDVDRAYELEQLPLENESCKEFAKNPSKKNVVTLLGGLFFFIGKD